MGTIQRDGEHVLNTHKPQKADDSVYYLNGTGGSLVL